MTLNKRAAVLFFLAMGLSFSSAWAAQKVAYPTADAPLFVIQTPDNWKLTPAEDETGYFTVEGPTGAILYFRTIPYDAEDIDIAIAETEGYIDGTYSDVEMEEATEDTLNGLKGFSAAGKGKDDEGNACVFACGWYDLGNGKVAEIWFEAEAGDAEGAQAAAAVLKSLATP